MRDYRFPYKDAGFILNNLIDFDQICANMGLEEVNGELATAILEEAGRLGGDVLAPLNAVADELGATLKCHDRHGRLDEDAGPRTRAGERGAGAGGAWQSGPRLLPGALSLPRAAHARTSGADDSPRPGARRGS